jgi:hypothetical protein
MTTSHASSHAARLALLACDVDELVQQATTEPLTDADALALTPPAAHPTLAIANLQAALQQAHVNTPLHQ